MTPERFSDSYSEGSGTRSTGMESGTSHQTAERAGEVKDRAKEQAGQVMDEAKHKASDMAHQAQQKVQHQLDAQKNQATDQIGHVQQALRQTSDNLRQQNQDMLAGYMDSAAQQVERLNRYLSERSVGELMGEAERFARREPALFMGGALLLGLFGARFFKSSSPESQYERRAYGGEYRRAYDTYPPVARREPRSAYGRYGREEFAYQGQAGEQRGGAGAAGYEDRYRTGERVGTGERYGADTPRTATGTAGTTTGLTGETSRIATGTTAGSEGTGSRRTDIRTEKDQVQNLSDETRRDT